MATRPHLPQAGQPLAIDSLAVLAGPAAGDETGLGVVTVPDEQGRSNGARFVIDLPADPAGRAHLVGLPHQAAGRLNGDAGYLAYALVEDNAGQHTTSAVIDPIAPGPRGARVL